MRQINCPNKELSRYCFTLLIILGVICINPLVGAAQDTDDNVTVRKFTEFQKSHPGEKVYLAYRL